MKNVKKVEEELLWKLFLRALPLGFGGEPIVKHLLTQKIKGEIYVFALVQIPEGEEYLPPVVWGIPYGGGSMISSNLSPLSYEYTHGGKIFRAAQKVAWELAEQQGCYPAWRGL